MKANKKSSLLLNSLTLALGVVLATILSLGLSLLLIKLQLPLPIVLGLTVLAALIPLMVWRPFIGLAVLTVLRNLIDAFDQTIIAGLGGLNLASLLGLAIVPWALLVLLNELKQRRELGQPSRLAQLPLLKPWLILLAVIGVSTLRSGGLVAALVELVRTLDFFLLYLVSYLIIKDWRAIQRTYWLLAGALLLPAGLALGQWLTGGGFIDPAIGRRVMGTFVHPNALGFALLIGLGSLLVLLSLKQTKHKLLLTAGAGLLTAMLLLTFTRGAWLGLLVILLGWLVLAKRRLLLPLTVAALILALVLPTLGSYALDSLNVDLANAAVVERLDLTGDAETSSLLWRQRIWRETLPAFWTKPWLGHGAGSFRSIREQFNSLETDLLSLDAHNDYLRLGIELGAIGLGAFLLLQLGLIKRAIQALRSNPTHRKELIGYLSIVVALLTVSLADNVFRNAPVQWMFWVLTGAIMASIKFNVESKKIKITDKNA